MVNEAKGEGRELFSELDLDTIGEIMNISMGSAATSASTLLDNQVSITTPRVDIVSLEEFTLDFFEPAVAVDITYMEGIYGSNILILKKQDIRTILCQMLGMELEEGFELDEMAQSAIGELMNQMMGASATVLSLFLERDINISVPLTIPVGQMEDFKREHFAGYDYLMVIEFTIAIQNVMNSKFISVMSLELAQDIIGVSMSYKDRPVNAPASRKAGGSQPSAEGENTMYDDTNLNGEAQGMDNRMESGGMFGQMDGDLNVGDAEDRIPSVYDQVLEAVTQGGYEPPASMDKEPDQEPEQEEQQAEEPEIPAGIAADEIPAVQESAPQAYSAPPVTPPPAYAPPQPPQQGLGETPIVVKEYDYGDFSANGVPHSEQSTNLDLVMNVPVTVTVELGRTRRKIKEILEFGQGTIVELDKQAGSQVDVIVNGQLIARGDVVVVDDNFSIRITEILKSRDTLSLL